MSGMYQPILLTLSLLILHALSSLQFDPNDRPIRNLGTLYNLIGECAPHRAAQKPSGADKEPQGTTAGKRPALQIN